MTTRMNQIHNLALARIEGLVDMATRYANLGDESTKEFLLGEARILAMVMDGADETFYMTYHRYSSDSYGVVFELEHDDPELMFGGV